MTTLVTTAASSLRKSISLGAMRAMVRLVCGFASVKLTAVYLGPSGLALIAQFNNFMALCQSVVVTGLETAGARLTAEYIDDRPRRSALLHTLGKLALGLGLPTAFLVAVCSPWLAEWLLNDAGYAWVFVLGSLAILASIVNSLLIAVISAQTDYVRAITSNIAGTILGLVIFAPAAMRWGIPGGLAAASVVYLGSLGITLWLLRQSDTVKLSHFVGQFNRAEAKRIAAFYPMLLVHAVMAPLSIILIRQHVSSLLSLESAGIWQAAWRLSETYLMIIMTTVTTQFMVRLGRVANHPARLQSEVLRTLAVSVGGTAAIAACVFLLRGWIVRILFTSAFAPVVDLMPMQLVGDILKMVGWTLGFVLVSTVRSRWYVAIEIIVPLVFIVAARILGARMGVSGVPVAYAISGLFHAGLSLVALRDVLFLRRVPHENIN